MDCTSSICPKSSTKRLEHALCKIHSSINKQLLFHIFQQWILPIKHTECIIFAGVYCDLRPFTGAKPKGTVSLMENEIIEFSIARY